MADTTVAIRIPTEELELFKEVSMNAHGKKYPDLLRELIVALNENRLTVTPTEDQLRVIKRNTKLYKVN